MRWIAVLCAIASVHGSAFAATIASDNASVTNYPGPWTDGSNGGTGFAAWQLSGTGGQYIGSTGQGNPAFGIFSDPGKSSLAKRPFTGGALTAGQTFQVDLGNTQTIDGEIGLNLLSGSIARFTLKFVPGQPNWLLNDGGSDFSAGQAYAKNTSLAFSFTYLGSNDYSYTFGSGSGTDFTATDDISAIDGVQFYSNGQGAGENFGFNNLAVTAAAPVPEPTARLLLVSASCAVGVGVRLRRRWLVNA